MPSVNKVFLVATLGKDTEVRQAQNGTAICNISAATSRKYKDAQGNAQEETEWHRISLFGTMAELAGQYLKKGSMVYIEGRLRTRKYKDKDGIDRYVTEIIGEHLQFLDKKPATVRSTNVRKTSPAPEEDCPF
nr:MAG TPA: Single strand binding protein [Caudoviricetes sp.]